MKERERIIELMKKGVLSTEEGLDLLENVAKKEDKVSEKQEFENEEINEETVEESDFETEDQTQAEETLGKLVEEINRYSVELDETNDALNNKREELTEKKVRLSKLSESKETSEEKQALLEEIQNIQKELELIKQMDEVDNTNEIIELREQIDALSKEIDALDQVEDPDIDNEKEELSKQMNELEEEISALKIMKQNQMKNLHRSKFKQWTLKAKNATTQFDIPDDWKKEASKAGSKIEETSKEWSDFIKKSVKEASGSEFAESVRSTVEDTLGHFDWKDVNVKFPTLATKEFKKDWTFKDSTATILDLKIANGKLSIKQSEDDTITLFTKGKLYGKMDEETPVDSFNARSTIKIDEDKLVVHVPNKRVYVEADLYLPKRTYDYVSINMLNGKLDSKALDVKDIFAKSTNGEIVFDQLTATMLEAKGSNGTITVKDSKLKDFLASSINGSIVFRGETESSDVSTTNGDVKFTLSNQSIIRLNANTVNGNVKLAIPKSVSLEGKAKTTFGKVRSRLSGTEPEEKVEHTVRIRRVKDDKPLNFYAGTTTGNVLLKDTDN